MVEWQTGKSIECVGIAFLTLDSLFFYESKGADVALVKEPRNKKMKKHDQRKMEINGAETS